MANVSGVRSDQRSPRRAEESAAADQDRAKFAQALEDALTELHLLLRAYSPPWYTERHHQRTEDLLRMDGRL